MKSLQLAESIQTLNDALRLMDEMGTLDDNYYLHTRIGTLLYLIIDKTPDCYHRSLMEAIVRSVAEADQATLSLLATTALHEVNVTQQEKARYLQTMIKDIERKVKNNTYEDL